MQKAVGGGCLGARDIGGMSAYEAKSHRRQNCQNFQNTLNRSRMRNCTTNFIGSTALPTVIDTVSGSLMPTKRGWKLYKILREKQVVLWLSLSISWQNLISHLDHHDLHRRYYNSDWDHRTALRTSRSPRQKPTWQQQQQKTIFMTDWWTPQDL